MAGNKVLLDTNIISALFKGDVSVANHIDKSEVYLSSIIVGELCYGAEYSTKIEENIANIKQLISTYNVLSVDEETSFIYGKIKADLRKKGTPIPENDIWIASSAIQHKLKLSTRDKHFQEIKGLKILAW
ncbi:type II toxin-antitoxin system VapC family toxin [Pedobacter sp. UBA5917]|jgi:tRNA(fMet)-specific endonuclease VapC|uniref:type II toxin-antitoxin system VapC family toxin n=1 Tax=Pedobacter sp. UBA5917 TaxID=1947061 RepID=UPI0025D0D2C9|nr:type II toxin-antitoxin system VapC family toxin [Pedobacter sp. UBA5917]